MFSFCFHTEVSQSSKALPSPPSCDLSLHNYHSKVLKETTAICTCTTAKHFADAAFLGGGGSSDTTQPFYTQCYLMLYFPLFVAAPQHTCISSPSLMINSITLLLMTSSTMKHYSRFFKVHMHFYCHISPHCHLPQHQHPPHSALLK